MSNESRQLADVTAEDALVKRKGTMIVDSDKSGGFAAGAFRSLIFVPGDSVTVGIILVPEKNGF